MDREAYRKIFKMPKPRDHKVTQTLDKNDQLSLKNSKYRIDYRPKVFLRLMKLEVLILLVGIGFAISKII